eukprot:Em0021g66a
MDWGSALIKAGVGDYGNRNRYCAIAFGGIGPLEPAHFLLVNGEKCFTADQFPKAKIQLQNAGLNEDGYEAIHFAINNVPFRDSPFIAKNLLLITDEGRTAIPQGQDLTKAFIRDRLLKNGILLNVVATVTYNDTANATELVLGQSGTDTTYLIRPHGKYLVTRVGLAITKSDKDTVDAYIDLALGLNGASWSLPILRNSSATSNLDLQKSFTDALVQLKVKEISAQVTSCRRCVCASDATGRRVKPKCDITEDQAFCRCEATGNQMCAQTTSVIHGVAPPTALTQPPMVHINAPPTASTQPPTVHSNTPPTALTQPPTVHSNTPPTALTQPPTVHSNTPPTALTQPPTVHSNTPPTALTQPPKVHSNTPPTASTQPPKVHSNTPPTALTQPPKVHSNTPPTASTQPPRVHSNTNAPPTESTQPPRVHSNAPPTESTQPPRVHSNAPPTASTQPPRVHSNAPPTASTQPPTVHRNTPPTMPTQPSTDQATTMPVELPTDQATTAAHIWVAPALVPPESNGPEDIGPGILPG